MKGRILLCAYYFPPIGTPRSYRWKEFVTRLSSKGWEIDVLTIRSSQNHPSYDPELLEDVPEEVRIFRTYPGIMHHLSRLFLSTPSDKKRSLSNHDLSLRRLVGRFLFNIFERGFRAIFIPDEAILWFPFALVAGRQLVKKNRYDLIISSAFPFTAHIAGYFLSRYNRGKPWVADYGDPWVNNCYFHLPKWRLSVDKKIESSILKSISRIVVNTSGTRDYYLNMYPFLRPDDIKVIPQGVSQKSFVDSSPERTDKFRILYAGVFYKDREPIAFFDALIRLKEFWKDLEVIIAGNMPNAQYERYAHEKGLSEIVHFIGYVSQKRIFSLQKGASVLLLIGNRGGIQVPGKIYEYLASGRPILNIKTDENDFAATLVERYKRGISVANNPQELNKSINYLYNLWKNKRLDDEFDLKEIDEFGWDKLAEKLEDTIIEAIYPGVPSKEAS